jgi:hypothetical protein
MNGGRDLRRYCHRPCCWSGFVLSRLDNSDFLCRASIDLKISNNRFVEDRVSKKMPCGIYGANEKHGYFTFTATVWWVEDAVGLFYRYFCRIRG